MTKEIIINAGEMESRVAVLENGRLMELHVEREPKIVGNIYRGRVTKVLKGMDAAFVDIGIERNAFLAASDVVPAEDEDDNGHGRNRGNVPPITQLLRNNQEVLVQVVRAPLGTKGARITTRLSLPGRYMVLMLNSGAYVGVSRKIEDPKERQRLRALANELRPENYSLIVRTEAEGKSDEELRQDLTFLLDMAGRIEKKAANTTTPSLVHGDLSLIFRLIRDAFTRDVNRLVVDSPSTHENVLELVGLIAPRMKNRVFLYDEPMPIFHAYNIEPEIERTLRRKVWLPSGGTLIIDQAEALTAIDVNTGRFVGSVELAETVLTTNLQAAEETARQLRLRDLGGIIVVDFIDMDNPRHRQQVMAAFEEALRRDRAKLKVHSISSLGLVEMTRKRTGDSLVRLLTEPCPYCSGIGRVQNSLTMALRVERDLAATAVEHPETEAYLLAAHPRVIANMLGYEGEAHRDLEAYLERPVYLRIEENFHPNTYRLDRLTLEQALIAVKRVEEGEIIEAQVANPDPEVSLAPLVQANGIYMVVPDLDAPVGARVKVRVTDAGTSLATAEPLAEEQRGIRAAQAPFALQSPPLVPESVLPAYLRDERALVPPRGLQLLSPTAEAAPTLVEEEEQPSATAALVEASSKRRPHGNRRRRKPELTPEEETTLEAIPQEQVAEAEVEEMIPEAPVSAEAPAEEQAVTASSRRRRRRRRGRGGAAAAPIAETAGSESVLDVIPAEELPVEGELAAEVVMPAESELTVTPVEPAQPARRRRSRRRRTETPATQPDPLAISVLPVPEPVAEPVPMEEISPEAAAQAMQGIINAIAGVATPGPVAEPTAEMTEEAPAPPKRRTARRRTTRKAKPAEQTTEETVLPVAEASIPAPVEPLPAAPPVEPAPAAEAAPAAVELTVTPEKPKRRRRTAPATATATEGGTPPRRRTRKPKATGEVGDTPPVAQEPTGE